MKQKLPLLFALFSSLIILYGCSNNLENNEQKFDIVASEKNLPANMEELAFKREDTPRYQYLVRMAKNQADFEEFWELYEFENQAPELEFNEKNIFLVILPY